MAFKENYKDEIATRRYQIIDNKTGAIINPDVALKRIDTPTQVGDKFISKDVNAIATRLNELENAVVTEEDITLIGKAMKFSGGLTLSNGANEILYQFVKGVGHTNIHTGNIGSCTAGNSFKLQGYAVINRIGVFNPSGNDWVVIPCEGKDVQFAIAINGNWDAANVRVISIARQFTNMLVFIDRPYTGNIQINYMMFYPT